MLVWMRKHAGLLLIVLYLVVHLAAINDYGFTWDYHFHLFGGGKLMGYDWQQLEPRALPYVDPDPRNAWTLPYGALMSIPPVASFLLLHKTWGLLPADNAYHLPILLWGVSGVGVLYLFLKEAFSRRIAFLAGIFLALTPRYFGDLHNNMKDVPSSVIFALNVWLLWRLVKHRRVADLIWASLAFAVAFNVKINSMFIPVVFGVWLTILQILNTKHEILNKNIHRKTQNPKLFHTWNFFHLNLVKFSDVGFKIWGYFLLAPLAAFALWSVFWPHPIAQLIHAYRTFGVGTNNIEVILNGAWYCSGSTVPWYYPWWYLAITTPITILLFFLIGIGKIVISFFRRYQAPNPKHQILNKHKPLNVLSIGALKSGFVSDLRFRNWNFPAQTLLILWLIVPLTRYFLPTIGVIDGVRHFEEVLFPLAALAAIGLDFIMRQIGRIKPIRHIDSILFLFILYSLLFTVYSYHPYQITYFNELVGGVKGAMGKYDLDYWGTSQKAAILWVNAHAPQNANVHIVMAAAVAGQYLRPDLLANLNTHGYDESDFVVLLNRQSFLYRFYYAYEYLLHHRPAYTVSVRDTPLTWIFDNRTDNATPRQTPWWQGEDPCIRPYWKGVQ